jgi:hypothetical protein
MGVWTRSRGYDTKSALRTGQKMDGDFNGPVSQPVQTGSLACLSVGAMCSCQA